MTTEILWCQTHDIQIMVRGESCRAWANWGDGCREVPMLLVRKDAPSITLSATGLSWDKDAFLVNGCYVLAQKEKP